MLKAFFDITHPYFVTSPFTLVVVAPLFIPVPPPPGGTTAVSGTNPCYSNVISAPVVQSQTYVIGDPQLVIQLPTWQLTLPECGPLKFQMKTDIGDPLPKAITLAKLRRQLRVFSFDPSDVGTYNLEVKGTTQYYHESSVISAYLSIEVKCVPRILKPQVDKLSFTYSLGDGTPPEMLVSPFLASPPCQLNDVSYVLLMKDGS